MSAFANIAKIPELRRRILFTLGMIAVYRIGIFVTIPGIDRNVLREYIGQQGGFLGMFNLFSGGALEQASIFSLGIMPYVTASIVLQLMTIVVPQLGELRKEGEAGQRKINQYTRYGTVVISVVQGIFWANYFQGLNAGGAGTGFSTVGDVVRDPGWGFVFLTVIALTTGTAFIMWLGEQITERGIGNGISLIIFAGIVADLPRAGVQTMEQVQIGQIQPVSLLMVAAIVLLVIAVITFFERGQRRIPIHYAKRLVGRKLYGGQTSHLPLRVNSSGVIAPIFASSLLMFPQQLVGIIPGMETVNDYIQPGSFLFNLLYVVMIVFFAFFYTAVTFQPVEVADNLKKQNAFIPKVRPGKATAEYIDRVLTRITVGGAIYVALVCVVPQVLQDSFHVPFFFGGTSVMIVVGVALDTVQQIESHLITRHYEGLTGPRGPRIRGRRTA
ncbi:preprotein translocase subunit SecY [Sandaracinus amylolyticus]|uniref:Protein translocase subunit SecY n=1 Tax=Sandaracinus amylolyticus TaxID=927083 RepID=A0A0F6W979_9BACT|nr:preprotein translocase subunit SecY [Sandaracinus amylolyticus]AKF10623.1 Preprotein translocase secY subunit [Sandaracinus amylolyticus]